jgi:hypothetical protein
MDGVCPGSHSAHLIASLHSRFRLYDILTELVVDTIVCLSRGQEIRYNRVKPVLQARESSPHTSKRYALVKRLGQFATLVLPSAVQNDTVGRPPSNHASL